MNHQEPEVSSQMSAVSRQQSDQKHRRLTYSPDEEYTIRCHECGAPNPISESTIFLLLTDVKTRTVTKNGIQFKPPGATDSLLYWDPVSEIFDDKNVGQIVKFRFDPDDHQLIYVLRANGSLWDVLPADTKPAMLDTAAQSAMRARTEIPYRMAQAKLSHYHKPTVAAETARKKQNALRMNSTRTFPVPSNGRSQETEDSRQNAADSGLGTEDQGLSSNSRADAVQGEPASAATPAARGGAFQLGPNTSEPVAHETKRGNLSERSPQSLVPSPQSETQDSRLRTRDYILTQRSHPSASATSPDAGAAGDRLNDPTPRQILSEQMDRAGRRARVRVGRAVTQRQQARVDYSDALDDLAVSVTSFNQPNEGE